jgi:exosortase E/protease (VPEID-CTERM system)
VAVSQEPIHQSEAVRQLRPSRFLAWGFSPRIIFLAVLFVLELILVSGFVHNGLGGMGVTRWIVAFTVFFFTFGYLTGKRAIHRISSQLEGTEIAWGLFVGHLGAMFVFMALSVGNPSGSGRLFAVVWYLSGTLALALAVFAFVPPRVCWQLIRGTGVLWAYAVVAGSVACLLVNVSWSVWQPATYLTFALVRAILGFFSSSVVADPAMATIGTQGFHVFIGAGCSGLEGVGLMLVFSVGWLWFFRHECRFPRALLLIPAGLLTVWLLNGVRIAVLILIGNAGAPGVATGGFHSQAGWIGFNAVALGFSLATRRLPWITVSQLARPRDKSSAENPSAAYLMPFLMILAAAMISRAASDTFEWLYPLRFFAAAAALWYYRSKYVHLDWRFGWLSAGIGGLVFVFWLALDQIAGNHADNGIPAGLALLPTYAAMIWLGFRTVAAVVTVPMAEELAFRGFLIRRLISSDFESIDSRTFTYFSVLVSSLAFGLLHGERWLAGTVAGIVYAAAFLRRGKIGDAVVAHATTNALLAACVLFRGQWYLW